MIPAEDQTGRSMDQERKEGQKQPLKYIPIVVYDKDDISNPWGKKDTVTIVTYLGVN